MTRRSVASLADGDTIDDIYLARDKQLRTNRAGNLYVQLELADRTGMLMARMWNAGQGVFGSFADGDLVRVATNRGCEMTVLIGSQCIMRIFQGAVHRHAHAFQKCKMHSPRFRGMP